jgi:cell division protease FtsH
VRALLDRAHARAVAILERNRALLEEGARELLAREALDEADVAALRRRLVPAPGPVEARAA